MIAKDRERGISDFVGRCGRDIAEHMADRRRIRIMILKALQEEEYEKRIFLYKK